VNFASDNTTGASPAILEAITGLNDGRAMPYGQDDFSHRAADKIREIFETDAEVFFVATGTAANTLSLSVLTPSYGAVLCHWQSHIYEDECGGPEFFTGGAKLIPIGGPNAKFDLEDLDHHAGRGVGDVHMVQPSAVSITQVTEFGAAYTRNEIEAVGELCRQRAMKLHMDGARFANAVAALDCAPADITWKAGVDVLSFGATKNGAMASEAVVLFDKALAQEFAFRRKRGGHLFSKMRLLAGQMETYLTDDLWLSNARHANAMASRLADGLASVPGIEITAPVDANMLFPKLPRPVIEGLWADGFQFYDGRWEPNMVRLVTAFNTREEDVDAFVTAARRHIEKAA